MTMTDDQVRDLLVVIVGYDRRASLDAATVTAWTEAARRAGWRHAEAVEAVRAHYDQSRDVLLPAMVTERIRATRRLPPLPGSGKQVLSPKSDPNCKLCDEYGYVIDPDDKYGWAIVCQHDPHQLLPQKPASVHEAARILREGRARAESG
ncbi:hypothetical protein, partial [Streptomyces parvus]|uniref:hypothetical protein n=2 Tax=Actinomycetes TaxID=1760 RepID=UPI0033EE6D53